MVDPAAAALQHEDIDERRCSAISSPLSAPRTGRATRIRWVRWTLIGVALAFLTLFLFIPLISVFYEALKKGIDVYVAAITDPDALSAITAYLDRRGYRRTA